MLSINLLVQLDLIFYPTSSVLLKLNASIQSRSCKNSYYLNVKMLLNPIPAGRLGKTTGKGSNKCLEIISKHSTALSLSTIATNLVENLNVEIGIYRLCGLIPSNEQ